MHREWNTPCTPGPAEGRAFRWQPPLGATAFTLALLVSLAFVGQRFTQVRELHGDEVGYDRLAWNFMQGNGYSLSAMGPYLPDVTRPPGYPVFVASLYAFFGRQPAAVFAVQAILAAFVCLLAARIACLVCRDQAVGRTVAFSAAIYPFWAFYAGRLLTEVLVSFTVAAGLLLLLLGGEERRLRWTLAGSALLGFAILTRPALLLLPVAMAIALAVSEWRGFYTWRRSTLVILVAASIVLPWTGRNRVVSGHWIPVATGGIGWSLMIASWEFRDLSRGLPATTGFEDEVGYYQQLQAARGEAEAAAPGPDREIILDRLLLQQGWENIRRDPVRFLRGCLIRLPRLWVSSFSPEFHPKILWGVRLAGVVVLWAGAWGIWVTRRAWKRTLPLLIPIGYVTAVHLPLHAEARYTIPGRPFLLIFVVVGAIGIWRGLRHAPGEATLEARG